MNKTHILTEVRTLVAQARQAEAIEKLSELLNTDDSLASLRDTHTQIESELSSLNRDLLDGVTSESDASPRFAAINRRILALATQAEVGPSAIQKPMNRWIIGGIVGLLLAGAGYWFYASSKTQGCPDFSKGTKFKVVVYPFNNLGGQTLSPELEVRDELNQMFESNNLNAEAVTSNKQQIESAKKAREMGQVCENQMAIWGAYEKTGDSTVITVRYALVDREKWDIQNLKIQGESGLRAVRTVSSIDASGELLGDVTVTIKRIFGMVAMYNSEPGMAAAEWENIDSTMLDTTMRLLLADTYISLGKEDKALAQYDAYFESGGNATAAYNNRAMLNCNKGQYALAVRDLNRAVRMSPQDTLLLKNQVYALGKNEQDVEANTRLANLEQLAVDNKWVAKQKPVKAARAAEAERKVTAARAATTSRKSPNPDALLAQAEAEKQAGKTQDAYITVQKAIKMGANKSKAYALRYSLELVLGKSEDVLQSTLKEARIKGVSEDKIRAPKLSLPEKLPIFPDTTALLQKQN